MALNTDYTTADYNSFSTVAEMDEVIAELGVLYTATFWKSLEEIDKEALIKNATRYINTLEWLGEQNEAIIAKAMLWPRTDIENVAEDAIPYEILLKMGCWIIHNASANGNGSGNAEAGSIISKKVGDVAIGFESKSDIIKAKGGVVENPCDKYAKDFLANNELDFGIGGLGMARKP